MFWSCFFFTILVFSRRFRNILKRLSYISRSSHPEMFVRNGVLKICSKFTGEHLCRSVISLKLLCNFIEIVLRHGCSPVDLLYFFRTPFPRNASGWLLLYFVWKLARTKEIVQIRYGCFSCVIDCEIMLFSRKVFTTSSHLLD